MPERRGIGTLIADIPFHHTFGWEPQPLTGVSADKLLSPSETAHERDEHRYAVTFLRGLQGPGTGCPR